MSGVLDFRVEHVLNHTMVLMQYRVPLLEEGKFTFVRITRFGKSNKCTTYTRVETQGRNSSQVI